MSDTRCPFCSADSAVADSEFSATAVENCPTVDGGLVSFKDAVKEQRLASAEFTQKHGLPTPAEIRATREFYGLNQEEFERALGVGKKTVVRWERGTVPPGGAANSLLWLSMHQPDAFIALASKNGVSIEGASAASEETVHADDAPEPRSLPLGVSFTVEMPDVETRVISFADS